MTFSVIIPTLNEEPNIRRCLAHVRTIDPDVEIVVADGGSADRSLHIAEEAGAVVCRSGCGRGIQMNAGAALASGDILLFLHADTRLPPETFRVLREFFEDENVQVGTFRVAYDARHPLLDMYTRIARYDSMFSSFGDQCIVARRRFFESLGGFPQWPLFEDVHFLRMARRNTRIYKFPATVTTSARRLRENGFVRQLGRDVWYIVQYWLGVPAEQLAAKYE